MIMAVIGIDSHKDVLTGCLVDASGVSIEQRSIANRRPGTLELVAWARSAGVQRVGIEGAGNYGRPATVALIGAGVPVVEVPPQMTADSPPQTAHPHQNRPRRRARDRPHLSTRRRPAPHPASSALVTTSPRWSATAENSSRAAKLIHPSYLEKIRCGYHNRTGPLTSGAGNLRRGVQAVAR